MSEWISVEDRLPDTPCEMEEDCDDDGYPQWHGMVSASIEISDGQNLARGHYRDDGSWKIYDAEHDFQIVEPEKITHWAHMIRPPSVHATKKRVEDTYGDSGWGSEVR